MHMGLGGGGTEVDQQRRGKAGVKRVYRWLADGWLMIMDTRGGNYPINPRGHNQSDNHVQMVDGWLANRSWMHMDICGQHCESVDWSVNRVQMVMS